MECLHICGTENLVARVCDPVRVPRKSRDRGTPGKEDQIQRPEASVTELFIYQRLYIVDIHIYIYISYIYILCIYIFILYVLYIYIYCVIYIYIYIICIVYIYIYIYCVYIYIYLYYMYCIYIYLLCIHNIRYYPRLDIFGPISFWTRSSSASAGTSMWTAQPRWQNATTWPRSGCFRWRWTDGFGHGNCGIFHGNVMGFLGFFDGNFTLWLFNIAMVWWWWWWITSR